ncbi:FliG C-terminal domain-containing protein [Aestuariivirga sp.]|uniref:FliG C-terminal domain-containing protein n=1 Tax=Aestuariivirga sp. TaxID=2650926 RepID=UPI0025BFD947|nr:FliG C-terminal domain-containing protein [Aestuariivirga sp.]MCA3554231.1 flagellar motor switch protein FliG [Aestuariivirga sp.]
MPLRPGQVPLSGRGGREKVAILLLALGDKLGTQLLQRFDSSEVKAIMSSAASISRVEKQDLDLLVDDFAANFARALGLGTDFDAVKGMVERAFSPSELSRMLGAQIMQAGEPAWRRFESGMENTLVPYLLDEHPQTIAFILSKLDGDFASRCLSVLPGDFRITVARRLLKVQPVEDAVTKLVEQVLEEDLLARQDAGLEAEGRGRLAAMLNKLDREKSGEILAGVAAWKPEEAARLKRLIFSFEDLGKLSQQARLALFDKLQTDRVVLALRGMDAALKEVALSSLGARARRMVEAELASDKGVRTKEGDAARAAIVAQVLEMVQRGDIELPSDEATAA